MVQQTEPNKITKEFAAEAIRQNVLLYPGEDVVRFVAREASRLPANPQGLDIGFGSGRHLKLMMDHGIHAHGVDMTPEALETFQSHFPDSPFIGDLIVGDLSDLKLVAGYFDIVIMWGVLFLRSIERMKSDFAKIAELLKPGGAVCVNFRTLDNWFCGLGEEFSPGFYLLDERAGAYNKALYCFVDEEQARDVVECAGMVVESFERNDFWKGQQQQRHSWWIVSARKPLV